MSIPPPPNDTPAARTNRASASDCDAPGDLPPQAWLVALLSLPHVGPVALRAILASDSAPKAWDRIVGGSVPAAVPRARVDEIVAAARRVDVATQWHRYARAGIDLIECGDHNWPSRLVHDPEPPALLFARGRCPDPPVSVAIVGTRACTAYGRDIATELGRAAARAGISVVSGLAMGIDAAAHKGAVSVGGAPPIAVLGAGFDRPTPAANRGLFEQVLAHGMVWSETPLGAASGRWRFPARNRIIAGLSDAVVVVESDEKGGSLYTVDEALRRDRPVLAVPGSIRSRTSRGTNALLVDGATPCRSIDDIFDVLGFTPHDAHRRRVVSLSPQARSLLDWGPQERVLVDDLLRQSDVGPGRWLRLVDELESAGLVVRDGAYLRRVGTIDALD